MAAPPLVDGQHFAAGKTVKKPGKLARAAGACHPIVLRNALGSLRDGHAEASAELNEALFEVSKRCEDPMHLQALVNHRADINAQDDTGRTALHAACSPSWISSRAAVLSRRERGAEIVDWLLENRADPGASDRAGYTPLHSAAFIGDDAAARSLLAFRADPNAQTLRGATPLELIESTCWSGGVSQTQCEQHGQVVRVITGAGGKNRAVVQTGQIKASLCPVS